MSHRDLGDMIDFGIAYYLISLALDFLTLMIIIWLALHSREFWSPRHSPWFARNSYSHARGVYHPIYCQFPANFLLYIGPWLAENSASDIFGALLPEAQVRVSSTSPLLVVYRSR